MKMKNTIILIALILLLSIILVITDTYSKYSSSASGILNGNAGVWSIIVNGQDITSSQGVTQNFNIQSLNYGTQEYVAPNNIAPGLSGDFQINIEPTDTDVAVRFDITVDFSNLIEQIELTSVTKLVNEVEQIDGIIQTSTNTFTGIIPLQDIVNATTNSIKFEFEWADDGTGLNDETDSIVGGNLEQEIINMPVTVTVAQYTGEEITQYIQE